MFLSPTSIEAAYQRLGHTKGWRFLTCPARNIDTSSVALVTINPGGASFAPPQYSVEAGSAYVIESWKGRSPGEENLQKQVRRMFEVMDVVPDTVLSGYFVPFRSQKWEQLPCKDDSISFGAGLWREVLKRSIAPHVKALLNGAIQEASYPAAWGRETIDTYRFGSDGRLIVLPHLSHFKLFGRPQSEAAFRCALKLEGAPSTVPAALVRARDYRREGTIRKLVNENPKKLGSKSRLRFDCYRDGMTVADYESAVSRSLGETEARKCEADIKWDSERHFIRVEF
jgi:hypothetical protein